MFRKVTDNFFSRIQTAQTPTLFDRCESRARSAEWLAATLSSPNAVILGFFKNEVAMRISASLPSPAAATAPGSGSDGSAKPLPPGRSDTVPAGVASVPPTPPSELIAGDIDKEVYLLGVDTTSKVSYFARRLVEGEQLCDPTVRLFNLRNIFGSIDNDTASLLAQGKSLVEWHRSSVFCGFCGHKTVPLHGGRSRQCTQCEKTNYPRTNPVAIMLVISPDGTRCLLGQTKARHVGNLFSCLAGFVDQGESLENAACRETYEEAGVLLDPRKLRFHSSQPWPYPFQLMLGVAAVATSDEINFDREEMHDVRWFSKELVRKALAFDSDELQVPPPVAIANLLMQAWVDGEFDGLAEASEGQQSKM